MPLSSHSGRTREVCNSGLLTVHNGYVKSLLWYKFHSSDSIHAANAKVTK